MPSHLCSPRFAVTMSDGGPVDLTCHETIDVPSTVNLRLNLRHAPPTMQAAAAVPAVPMAASRGPITVCLNERLNIWVYTPTAAHAVSVIQQHYRSYRDRHLRTATGLVVSHAFWVDPIVAARIATLERVAWLEHNEAAARRVAATATPTEADLRAAQEHDERVQAYLDMCNCRWVGSCPPSPASRELSPRRFESPEPDRDNR